MLYYHWRFHKALPFKEIQMRSVVFLLLLQSWSSHAFLGSGFITPGNQEKWIQRSISAEQSLVLVLNSISGDNGEDDNNNESTTDPAGKDGSGRSSDMTDRFKYQVNALMGTYDPLTGVDNERQEGNILQAMLDFPVRYTFHVVGKTGGEASSQKYVDDIKKVILGTSGDNDAKWDVQQRGAKFTKIKCEVEVQSSAMVNKIYTEISTVDGTVMRF